MNQNDAFELPPFLKGGRPAGALAQAGGGIFGYAKKPRKFEKSPRLSADPLLEKGAKIAMPAFIRICFCFLLCSTLLLQGCGFHLRGSYPIPEALKIVHISPYQPYDPFQRALRQMLAGNGVQIVDSASGDAIPPSTLTIKNQQFEERPIAYGVDGRVTRTRLALRLEYAVDIQPAYHDEHTIRVARDYNPNPSNVLGTENEGNRLKEDLYEAAAAQCILELSLVHRP
jgi:LPS-assembly lipoprotein